jgi:pimeloyl-ACP methyl ester carboxylesterase
MAGDRLPSAWKWAAAAGSQWTGRDQRRLGPPFIERLASANELILLDNRGIGASTDNGAPFDIDQLADDTVRVIEGLGFEHASVLGWSLGGFIAQPLALEHPYPALH